MKEENNSHSGCKCSNKQVQSNNGHEIKKAPCSGSCPNCASKNKQKGE